MLQYEPSLLNITYKIRTSVLAKSAETYTQEFIGEYQCGFLKGRYDRWYIFTA